MDVQSQLHKERKEHRPARFLKQAFRSELLQLELLQLPLRASHKYGLIAL